MKKVMFVASDGGHLNELLTLEPLFDTFQSSFVIEQTKRELLLDYPVYFLKKGTRKQLFRYMYVMLSNIMTAFRIVWKENPEVIVTTGAHTAVPVCLVAKLKRTKIVYIESIARVHSKSLTGKILEKLGAKILVQWPELTSVYAKSQYIGRLS